MEYPITDRNIYATSNLDQDLHSSKNHYQDFAQYFIPRDCMHHFALHGTGIAAGLEVSGIVGGTELVVSPGVAVDGSGNMIILSSSGSGGFTDSVNPPSDPNKDWLSVPVHLPLRQHKGETVYVTIQWYEHRVKSAVGGPYSWGVAEHLPWLRLQPKQDVFTAGTSLVLAIAVIDANGQLAEVTVQDPTHRRQSLGQSLEELRIRRSFFGSDPQLNTTTTAAFTAPPKDAKVTIEVKDTSWMAINQLVFIEGGAGFYEVTLIQSESKVELKNLGSQANAASGTNIASQSGVARWAAAETTAGNITPLVGGGLQLTVPNPGDGILLSKEDGTNCGTVEMRANKITCKTVQINAADAVIDVGAIDVGAIDVGAKDTPGKIVVNDNQGSPGLQLDGGCPDKEELATITVGMPKNPGAIVVNDSQGNPGVRLDGDASRVSANKINPTTGQVIDINAKSFCIHGSELVLGDHPGVRLEAEGSRVSANQINAMNGRFIDVNAGSFRIHGSELVLGDNPGVRLDGDASTVSANKINPMKGQVIDVNADSFRIHGSELVLDCGPDGNKRALVDFRNTLVINSDFGYANGVDIHGNVNVRGTLSANGTSLLCRVAYALLFVPGAPGLTAPLISCTQDVNISLTSPKQFMAFVATVYIGPWSMDVGPFSSLAAEVYQVDGNDTSTAHGFYAPAFSGFAKTVTFRLRPLEGNRRDVAAIGIVFYE